MVDVDPILFIFNQISAKIRTYPELGDAKLSVAACFVVTSDQELDLGLCDNVQCYQHIAEPAPSRFVDSFNHTRQSLVSLRHFPTKLIRPT